MSRFALVTDFDGTITQTDFFLLIPDTPDYLQQWREGRLTHFEAMRNYFRHAPTDDATLKRMTTDCRLDPALPQAIQRLASAEWEVIVVSAGCSWYIERMLAGLDITIHASPGEIIAGRGLEMSLPTDSPFFSPTNGIDKIAVMRDALATHERVAFAGDGPPDLDPILLAAPELRFARRWLAAELQRRGEPFQRFERWSDIVNALLH